MMFNCFCALILLSNCTLALILLAWHACRKSAVNQRAVGVGDKNADEQVGSSGFTIMLE
jgi:hypothetical protein